MKSKRLFALSLLSVAGLANAEGGRPSGMIPYSGTDLSSCGPVPAGYYNNSSGDIPQSIAPPTRWADKWGAIALSGTNDSVGVSTDMTSEEAARTAALEDCQAAGGGRCLVQLAYYNQCGVLAWSERFANSATAGTIEEASDIAINTCSKNTSNCKIVYSNCTRARRIQ